MAPSAASRRDPQRRRHRADARAIDSSSRIRCAISKLWTASGWRPADRASRRITGMERRCWTTRAGGRRPLRISTPRKLAFSTTPVDAREVPWRSRRKGPRRQTGRSAERASAGAAPRARRCGRSAARQRRANPTRSANVSSAGSERAQPDVVAAVCVGHAPCHPVRRVMRRTTRGSRVRCRPSCASAAAPPASDRSSALEMRRWPSAPAPSHRRHPARPAGR